MALDPFAALTGSAYDQAAQQQLGTLIPAYNGQMSNIATGQTQALNYIQGGTTGAVNAINTAIPTAQNYITQSIDPATGALISGQNAGVGALTSGQTSGLAALQGGVGAATAAYNPLSLAGFNYGQMSNQAQQSTADALGLNGPEGVARAEAQFQASPGYQYSYNQGIDAIDRSANTTGMAASGNTSRSAQAFGQNLADQDWQNYLNQLMGQQQLYAPLSEQAKGTAATGTANAQLTGGTGAANIYTGTGGQLSNLYSTTGSQLAPVYTGAGSTLASLAETGGLSTADVLNQQGTSKC